MRYLRSSPLAACALIVSAGLVGLGCGDEDAVPPLPRFELQEIDDEVIYPNGVALYDLDGEGAKEALVVEAETPGSKLGRLSVWHAPDWASPSSTPLGVHPRYPVVADFDEDGHADVFVAGDEGNSLLLGRGGSSLEAGAAVPIVGGLMQGGPFRAGDFDADGHLDLPLVAGYGVGTVHFLLGDGTGKFSVASADLSEGSVNGATGAVFDCDGDGHDELVIVNIHDLQIFRWTNADGIARSSVPVEDYSILEMMDTELDGDRVVDLVAAAVPRDLFGQDVALNVLTLRGRGDCTFDAPIVRSVAGGQLATADFDRDSRADLVTTSWARAGRSGYLDIAYGNGEGGYHLTANLFADVAFSDVATGDIDGDGWTDILVADNPEGRVFIAWNRGVRR